MAPATVLIRARRALHTDGRTVAPGDVARMPVESALAGIACGQLEIIGPEAVGVIVRPCLIGDNHAPRWRLVYCRRLLARLVRLDLARAFATPRRRSARAARA
ncbi:MAG: hypothetical protein LW860_07535 [Xanthomonadaceae bacterium]|jgi:hypothetical protein|nr:hypothetical protein [Xanthomonadaceae bacterium]